MERVNIVVLASLAAALTLVGLRLWAGSGSDFNVGAADARSLGFAPDTVRDRKLPPARIAMYGESGKPGPAQKPTPGTTPGGKKAGRSGSGGSLESGAISDAYERRRDVLGSEFRRGADVYEASSAELSDLLAGRIGAVPRGSGASAPDAPVVNDPQPFEFVDDGPKGGNPDVLLRIPFDGDVDPEVGGGDFQTDGLVSHDGRVQFPDEAQFSFPAGGNVNSETGTISFEVRPDWAGGDLTNNSLVQIRNEHIWENSLSIVKNLDALRFIIHDSAGVERNVNIPIDHWPPGEPQQVVATWDSDAMRLYVNGQLMGEATLPNPVQFSDSTPIHIGSDFPGTSYVGAGGSIHDFTVYARALSGNEIVVR